MAVLESQGVTFAIGNGNSPETFTTVGEATAVNGLGSGQATVINTSNLSSSRQEFIMGLPDEGELTIDLNLDPNDAGQIALGAARDGRTLKNFRITLNDSPSTVYDFSGYVLSFGKDVSVDTQITASVTVKITGAVTES